MLRWFRETAPIRRKLSVAFSPPEHSGRRFRSAPGFSPPRASSPSARPPTLGGGALLLSAVLGVVMRKAIADPYVTTVVRMEASPRAISTPRSSSPRYTDCVGRMTKAMFVFRKTAQDNIEAAKTLAATTRAAEEERKRTEAAAIAQQAALVVGSIGTGLTGWPPASSPSASPKPCPPPMKNCAATSTRHSINCRKP